jgi:hypothetical protein
VTIRTGKGGRYRYYRSSTAARQGETGCKGWAIPMEKLDDLVASRESVRRSRRPTSQPSRKKSAMASAFPGAATAATCIAPLLDGRRCRPGSPNLGIKGNLLRTLSGAASVKSATGGVPTSVLNWRRERDSNPRYGFPYTHFPGVRLQPLGHPSGNSLARTGPAASALRPAGGRDELGRAGASRMARNIMAGWPSASRIQARPPSVSRPSFGLPCRS